jgi:hypothetical protein
VQKVVPLLLTLFPIAYIHAQIQVRPLPEAGFDQRIVEYVNSMELVDTHEHLMDHEAIKSSGMLDFTLLLLHYADDDIMSAGMSKAQFDSLLCDRFSIGEKWGLIKPHWDSAITQLIQRLCF